MKKEIRLRLQLLSILLSKIPVKQKGFFKKAHLQGQKIGEVTLATKFGELRSRQTSSDLCQCPPAKDHQKLI